MLIPVISKLMGKTKKLAAARPAVGSNDRVRAEPLVLIVAPTRELCCQIFDEARRLCYRSMLRPCVAYGGAPVRGQADQIQRGCDILIASPGRLLDFMSRPNLLSLSRVRYTIIDEADEMLHDDWNEEMSKIMGGGGESQLLSITSFLTNLLQMRTWMVITITCSSLQPSPSVFSDWPRNISLLTSCTSVSVALAVFMSMSSSKYVPISSPNTSFFY